MTVSLVSPAKLRDMILHEIAHALTSNDSAHGKASQDKALAIGVSHEHVMSTRVALEEALTGKSHVRRSRRLEAGARDSEFTLRVSRRRRQGLRAISVRCSIREKW